MSGNENNTKSPAEILENAVKGNAVSMQDNNIYEAHKGLRDVIGRKPGGNVKLFARFQEKEAISRKSLVEDSLSKTSEAKQALEQSLLAKGGKIIGDMISGLQGQIVECHNKQAGLKLGSGQNLSSAEIVIGFKILETLSCKGMIDSILATVERVDQAIKRDDLSEAHIIIGDLVNDLNEQVFRHEQAIQAAREAYEN